MPIGLIATIDPIYSIRATRSIHPRAISDCQPPIILLGVLAIVAPSVFSMLLRLAAFRFCRGRIGMSRDEIIGAARGLLLNVVCLIMGAHMAGAAIANTIPKVSPSRDAKM